MAAEGPVDAVYRKIRSVAAGAEVGNSPTTEHAAAACLWRRSKTGGLELLVVQRAPSLAFLGGYWTFPGGRVEASDPDARHAAARELEEETGIAIEPDRLEEVCRFVTPDSLLPRFDAAYFLGEAPESRAPDGSGSGGEVTGALWVTPEALLERFARGEWLVPSPVTRVARALSAGLEGARERIALEAEEERKAPRLWPLADGIALSPLRTPTLPPATHTNCFVIGTDELVIIDPASPYPEEQEALDRALDERVAAGARVRAIYLTHHHLDHVGGASHLAERFDVPVAAHPETAARLAGQVAVAELLGHDHAIELGRRPRRRLRAVFTPGHAPGHLCFLEEETGFLVAGDMVAGLGTILIDPSEGDMGQYLASLALMKELRPRRLLPAHGGVIAEPAEKLDEYVRHRLWREERVVRALEERKSAPASELVAAAYADVHPAIYPLAQRSLLSHLVKLEAEGRARRAGELWEIAD